MTLENEKTSVEKNNKNDNDFNYQLLSRLQLDCNYFLGYGNGSERHLWAGSVDAQIEKMRELLDGLDESEKPEWITKNDIDNYEVSMKEKLEKKYSKEEVELEEREL
ncbi:MAG: LPD11 domain-containing protein [Bacteroidales bacterium]